MKKEKTNCDILAEMIKKNMEIACSVNNVTAIHSNKRGATLTIGLANEWAQKVARMYVGGEPYYVLLFVVNATQYNEIAGG